MSFRIFNDRALPHGNKRPAYNAPVANLTEIQLYTKKIKASNSPLRQETHPHEIFVQIWALKSITLRCIPFNSPMFKRQVDCIAKRSAYEMTTLGLGTNHDIRMNLYCLERIPWGRTIGHKVGLFKLISGVELRAHEHGANRDSFGPLHRCNRKAAVQDEYRRNVIRTTAPWSNHYHSPISLTKITILVVIPSTSIRRTRWRSVRTPRCRWSDYILRVENLAVDQISSLEHIKLIKIINS